MSVPQGQGELVFSATVTAWYSDFAESKHTAVALKISGPTGPPRYMAIPGGVADVPVIITLGTAAPGTVNIGVDRDLSPDPRPIVWIRDAEIMVLTPTDPRFDTYSRAPYFMGQPGRFVSDLPLALAAKQHKNGQIDYTLFYSNEDSGYGLIPPLILAVWGRTLDIEWAITVTDALTKKATYQSEDHGSRAFGGKWVDSHPVLFIANAHGTFSDKGKGSVLFAPGIWSYPAHGPREVFLDTRGWMVQTSDKELFHEKKLIGSTDKITKLQVPDLRKVLYVDINASLSGNKINMVLLAGNKKSFLDAGLGERAMLDSSGPKRVAIAFPPGITVSELRKNGILRMCVEKQGSGPAIIHDLTGFVLNDRFNRDKTPVFHLDHETKIDPSECTDLPVNSR